MDEEGASTRVVERLGVAHLGDGLAGLGEIRLARPPDFDADSGWRFFAGSESQDYADTPENFAFYDLNTIANYDPDIVPLLSTPAPVAFERSSESGPFVRVEPPDDPDE